VAALRPVVAPRKGKLEGTAGRGPFNDIMELVAVPEGVTFEAAILHVYGGWFNWGSAQAYRNFAG
jgi:monoterpene epsilon-lactone hydrolase